MYVEIFGPLNFKSSLTIDGKDKQLTEVTDFNTYFAHEVLGEALGPILKYKDNNVKFGNGSLGKKPFPVQIENLYRRITNPDDNRYRNGSMHGAGESGYENATEIPSEIKGP